MVKLLLLLTLAKTIPIPKYDLKASTTTLYNDYKKNEKTANVKYLGKRIFLNGKVERISANFSVIYFYIPGVVDAITATLTDNQIHDAWKIIPWQELRLVCTGLGTVFDLPIVHKCEFLALP